MSFDIKVFEHYVVWDNPVPSFMSRHAYFPGMVRLPAGEIFAMFPVGQAFESWDQRMYCTRSADNGRTWNDAVEMFSDTMKGMRTIKPALLDDGSLLAVGYEFVKTGNCWINTDPPSRNIISFSNDNGNHWTPVRELCHDYPEVLEFSGPALQLQNGELLVVGAPVPMCDGSRPSGIAGIALRSTDRGKSWGDAAVYFEHSSIVPLEARLAQMTDGRVIAIVWALDEEKGVCRNNHVVVSADNGRTWTAPIDTGIGAQASNILPLEGDFLLSVHAHRESEPAGVFVRVVDFRNNRWNTVSEQCIWSGIPAMRVRGYDDMGTNLKFGQPSILKLGNGEFLAYHWSVQNGQGRILAHHFKL